MTETQDRDQQILNRLAKIEHRVDSIDQTSAFALRAEEEKHRQSVRDIFGTSKRKAQVYLAANGYRGVKEIADHLRIKRQHVGRALNALASEGLLEMVDRKGRFDVWSKKALDKTLRITSFLVEEFRLSKDGKALAAKKTKRKRKHRR